MSFPNFLQQAWCPCPNLRMPFLHCKPALLLLKIASPVEEYVGTRLVESPQGRHHKRVFMACKEWEDALNSDVWQRAAGLPDRSDRDWLADFLSQRLCNKRCKSAA
eukprot:TRINITY_DN12202_c0_g1_i1.p1 TRINITY_DN12202_c0_g1~~TRINITY_DN12202_c0_g1_i1.p1  ORF type:complete len:106 (+),score=9.59 TRINITY_DN12202_c0_g1_i1:132-449(+)